MTTKPVSFQSYNEFRINLHNCNTLFFLIFPDTEVVKMKRVLELLTSENDEKVQSGMSAVTPPARMHHHFSFCVYLQERRIKELEESLTKCRRVQELVRGERVVHKADFTHQVVTFPNMIKFIIKSIYCRAFFSK